MSKKVSIIIPVYNVKPCYINDAINSVLAQTYKNIEIIVVNDGSTDKETLEHLETINNPLIKVINQENKGLGGARNTGIENASGDYISFLDADDWLDTDYYEKLLDICKNKECDIGCGILTRVTQDNNEICIDKYNNEVISEFTDKLKLVTNGSVCSKIFKREMFEDIRFVEHYYWEDNPILIKLLLKSNNVGYTTSVKYYYRENVQSICLNSEFKKQLKRKTDAIFILNEICNLNYKSDEEKDLAIRTFCPLVMNLKEFGLDVYCKNLESENDKLKKKYKKYKKLFNVTLLCSMSVIFLIILFYFLYLRGIN